MQSHRLEGGRFEIGVENPFNKAKGYAGDLTTRLPNYLNSNISPERKSTLPTLKQILTSALAFSAISMGGGGESAKASEYLNPADYKAPNPIEQLYKEGFFRNPEKLDGVKNKSAVEEVFTKHTFNEPGNPIEIAGELFEASLKDSANAGPEASFTISKENIGAQISGNFKDIGEVPEIIAGQLEDAIKKPVQFTSKAIMNGFMENISNPLKEALSSDDSSPGSSEFSR